MRLPHLHGQTAGKHPPAAYMSTQPTSSFTLLSVGRSERLAVELSYRRLKTKRLHKQDPSHPLRSRPLTSSFASASAGMEALPFSSATAASAPSRASNTAAAPPVHASPSRCTLTSFSPGNCGAWRGAWVGRKPGVGQCLLHGATHQRSKRSAMRTRTMCADAAPPASVCPHALLASRGSRSCLQPLGSTWPAAGWSRRHA